MFELLIALFGGAYHGIRYASDKRSHAMARAENEAWIEEHNERLKAWRSRVVNRQLEMELKAVVQKSNINEVKSALRNVGWTGKVEMYTDEQRENIVRLLMASNGRLMENDTWCGFNAGFGGCPSEYWQIQYNLDLYDIADFVDRKLREHGVNEMMYVKRTASNVFHPSNENSAHIGGTYVWAPMLPPNPEFIPIPDSQRINRSVVCQSLKETMRRF